MYSVSDTLAGGFPHSEICGSKRVCSLPAAYRKLLRPSSPVIAKASTMCTYSLVPITLASDCSENGTEIRKYNVVACLLIHTITTYTTLLNFFQIVKERNSNVL